MVFCIVSAAFLMWCVMMFDALLSRSREEKRGFICACVFAFSQSVYLWLCIHWHSKSNEMMDFFFFLCVFPPLCGLWRLPGGSAARQSKAEPEGVCEEGAVPGEPAAHPAEDPKPHKWSKVLPWNQNLPAGESLNCVLPSKNSNSNKQSICLVSQYPFLLVPTQWSWTQV